MSGCSMQEMKPKQPRTCGTCAHCEPCEWHCDSKESEYSWMVDVDDVDLPCGGYGYEHRSDGLVERYERLAQVAREMHSTLGDALKVLSLVRVPRQNNKTSFSLRTLKCVERYISFHDELEALGVSVDD